MTITFALLGGGLLLGGIFLLIFLWALKSGQYEDLDGSASRILFDDDPAETRRDSPPETPRSDTQS
jgi:cbb3-type cytochrome oxidase maturation protein